MKKHCYKDLDKPIQELMKILQEEYPNGFELLIGPDYAQLRHTSTELNFLSESLKFNKGTGIGMGTGHSEFFETLAKEFRDKMGYKDPTPYQEQHG